MRTSLKSKLSVWSGLFAVLAGLLFPLATASAVTDEVKAMSGTLVPGKYIIRFKDNDLRPDVIANQLRNEHGFQVNGVYRHAIRGMSITLRGARPEAVLNALSRNPNVASIGQDRIAVATAEEVPDGIDRVFGFLSSTTRANSGETVRVAIVDSGSDFNHPDLEDRLDASTSVTCTSGTCVPGGQDDEGHGSHVSGTVAASIDGENVVGIIPLTELVAVKVLGADGSGSFTGIIAGIDYLTGLAGTPNAVQVANMSLGAYCSVCTDGTDPNNPADPEVQALHDAINAFVASGSVLVTSSGNDGGDATFSAPSSFDEVITVSAITDTDGLPGGNGGFWRFPGAGKFSDDTYANFANYGPDVDVTAPGVQVLSVQLNGTTVRNSGTSMSSPHVAGVAALFMQDYKANTGSYPTPALVRQALIETGECAEGDGTVFHDGVGCAQTWSGDRDGYAEPLVRADRVTSFTPAAPSHDVAVTSVSAPSPVAPGSSNTVSVNVVNQGDFAESFSVTLADDVDGTSSNQSVSGLAAGASTILSFSWTPTGTGLHTLTATASTVSGETDTADNNSQTTSSVQEPGAGVSLTGLSPTSITGVTDFTLTVYGSGLASGASVSFENGSGKSPSVGTVSVAPDGLSLMAQVTVSYKGPNRPRTWDVRVTNPDGSTDVLGAAFTVVP